MANKQNILSEQDIAALASGAPAASADAGVDAAALAAAAEAKKVADDKVTAEAAVFAAARAEAETLEAARVAAEAAKTAGRTESDLVAFLNAQLKEKDAALLAAAVDLRDAKAKFEGIDATHTALTDMVRASISNMQVALGGSAADLSALTDVQVLAEANRLKALFTAKFKVGGVALSAAKDESEGESVVADPLQAAKLAAVKQATK